MLVTVLISFVVVTIIFAVVNKYTKKTEQPVIPTVEEEPLGYETSSLAELEQPACLYPGVAENEPELIPVVSEPESVSVEVNKEPKAKKKMSAKPKAKAPKKKKDA